MAKQAGAAGAETSPVNFCHWHRGPSGTARPIRFAGRTCGPPVLLYACAPCRDQRSLLPAAVRCQDVAVAPVSELSWEQIQGRACVSCKAPLAADRVWRDTVVVHQDGYGLPFDVWSCPAPETC
ncbi:hypothetical protein ABZ667_40470 [Streptomyces lavendulae]|uniref:hypothetical protein n=1 Tax=Streptomyces lavendulae TaxID=1914 RepID=UPI0033EC8EEB